MALPRDILQSGAFSRQQAEALLAMVDAKAERGTIAGQLAFWSTTLDRYVPVTAGALVNAVNDAAAAAGGVAVSGLYRNGSVLMIRVA